jgi:hypothetical protein
MRRRTLLVVLNALLLLQGSLGAQAACAQMSARLAQAAQDSEPCAEHALSHHAPHPSGTHDCCHAGGACHCAALMAVGPSVASSAPRAAPCAAVAGQSLMRPRPDELLRPPIL